MRPARDLLAGLLARTRVVDPTLEQAVMAAAGRLWPDAPCGTVQIGNFRRGVLHVVVASQARLAEAKSFFAETFREEVNAVLREQTARAASGPARSSKDAPYVTRVVFHAKGTF